jgi:hypothetical protein
LTYLHFFEFVVILYILQVRTSTSSYHISCKELHSCIINYLWDLFVLRCFGVTSTMGDILDPTFTVRLLSITRNQDLSDWVFCSSDQESLCRNLVESGITTMEFARRHCLAYSTMKRYMTKYRKWKTTGVRTQHISDYKQVQSYYYSLSVSSGPSGKCLSL